MSLQDEIDFCEYDCLKDEFSDFSNEFEKSMEEIDNLLDEINSYKKIENKKTDGTFLNNTPHPRQKTATIFLLDLGSTFILKNSCWASLKLCHQQTFLGVDNFQFIYYTLIFL